MSTYRPSVESLIPRDTYVLEIVGVRRHRWSEPFLVGKYTAEPSEGYSQDSRYRSVPVTDSSNWECYLQRAVIIWPNNKK